MPWTILNPEASCQGLNWWFLAISLQAAVLHRTTRPELFKSHFLRYVRCHRPVTKSAEQSKAGTLCMADAMWNECQQPRQRPLKPFATVLRSKTLDCALESTESQGHSGILLLGARLLLILRQWSAVLDEAERNCTRKFFLPFRPWSLLQASRFLDESPQFLASCGRYEECEQVPFNPWVYDVYAPGNAMIWLLQF